MKVIRRGVFETNSSSMHSLTILPKEKFERWTNGDYLYNGEVYSFKEAKEKIKEEDWFQEHSLEQSYGWNDEEWEDALYDSEFVKKETIEGDYETDYQEYKTENGELLSIFCYYGYDN